jgi:hypothetical protein
MKSCNMPLRAIVLPYCNDQCLCLSMSEWLLFNTDAGIVQLYYGENKLIFNEMIRKARISFSFPCIFITDIHIN